MHGVVGEEVARLGQRASLGYLTQIILIVWGLYDKTDDDVQVLIYKIKYDCKKVVHIYTYTYTYIYIYATVVWFIYVSFFLPLSCSSSSSRRCSVAYSDMNIIVDRRVLKDILYFTILQVVGSHG